MQVVGDLLDPGDLLAKALRRPAFCCIAESSPTASAVSREAVTITAPISSISGSKSLDLEQDDGFGRLLHLVDGVVHQADQILDVAAVERGDERPPHRQHHLAVTASASVSWAPILARQSSTEARESSSSASASAPARLSPHAG